MKTLVAAKRVSVSEDGTYAVGPTLESIASWLPSSWVGISPEFALNMITVYQCVRVLSNTFAQLPLMLYRRTVDGGKARATDHPLYDTFHLQPNPEMSSFEWRRLMMVHLKTWGNHYSEIVEGGLGTRYLYPVRPDRIEVSREGGVKVFDYLDPRGGKTRFRPGTIFHVQGISTDGFKGRSPISDMRASIRLGKTAEDFGESFFRNGARPATVLKHPKNLSTPAIDRLAVQMEAMRGSGNAGKTVVLEEGMDFKEIGVPPEDAQYMATRLFQKREIADGGYGVPAGMVGDVEAKEDEEQESLKLIKRTMVPEFVNFEQAAQIQVIDDSGLFLEFLVDGYLRGDPKARSDSYAVQWEHGALNVDEWRAFENQNPLPDKQGQTYWRPANWVPLDSGPVGVDGTPPTDGQFGQEAMLFDQLTKVKSAEVRCPSCKRLLAEAATPPYRITCRCKAVAEAGQTEAVA